MAQAYLRKTMDQVLEDAPEPEMNKNHVDDWHYATSSSPFKDLARDLKPEKFGCFNITAAITAPKSIKYRQMPVDWDEGKKGDYLFMDRSGNKMTVPYKLFRRLF